MDMLETNEKQMDINSQEGIEPRNKQYEEWSRY
jgi:hypothetical protein